MFVKLTINNIKNLKEIEPVLKGNLEELIISLKERIM